MAGAKVTRSLCRTDVVTSSDAADRFHGKIGGCRFGLADFCRVRRIGKSEEPLALRTSEFPPAGRDCFGLRYRPVVSADSAWGSVRSFGPRRLMTLPIQRHNIR